MEKHKGKECFAFIPHHEVPANKTPTYLNPVCNITYTKQKYITNIWSLEVIKSTIYSLPMYQQQTWSLSKHTELVFSTILVHAMHASIKKFCINSFLLFLEYARINAALIPKEFMAHFNLSPLIHNNLLYVRIDKTLSGLPQSRKIAHEYLKQHLESFRYYSLKYFLGLWKHKTRPIAFALVVNNFGIKYRGKENTIYLDNALKARYELLSDWEGKLYFGITLDWNYNRGKVKTSMPGYVLTVLHCLQYKATN